MQHALFRWENAVIIALMLLLTVWLPAPFAWWPWFGWILLGSIGVGVLFFSSLTDVTANAKLLLEQYQQRFDINQLMDDGLRRDVHKALEYQRRIEEQIHNRKDSLIKDRLEATAGEITDWISNVYEIAMRVDRYRHDQLIIEERRTLPREIEKLTAQRDGTENAALKTQMSDVIASKTTHLQSLEDLDVRMQQAGLRLDQSLTALATIYSQIQLIDSQSINNGRANRLQADIHEQVAQLGDLVDSINTVYNHSFDGIG